MTVNMEIHGTVDPQFAACLDAFRGNFREGGELGAACAVYRDGELVVDLWGGSADSMTNAVWERDTAVPVFSVTKGVAALCILSQVSAGAIDLDRPLAHYWPEFAAHGKGDISVRRALAHQAGVPLLSGKITLEDLADTAAMAARLANEPPLFEPGSTHAYHAVTIGWITSELMRRVTGQTVGSWFRSTLAEPLDLNIQIGRGADASPAVAVVEVPAEHDHIAVVGDNRKLVVFALSEMPVLAKGQGVTLQRYRDGGLSDAITLRLEDGLSWTMGGETGRTRTEKDVVMWKVARGAAGRMPPTGFPRDNKF